MNDKKPLWLSASALYVTALLSTVFVFIIFCAAEGLFLSGPTLFSSIWAPDSQQFGILPMVGATLALSFSSLIIGWLLALGCLCYIHGFGGKTGASLLSALLRIMTAIPTVVFGFASVFLLVPLIRDAFGGSGFSWLTATLVLSLLITPTMAIAMEGAAAQTAAETSLTAAALGLSKAENFVWVVLPASQKWLRGAALLGFGRAAGDTMIPTMLAGNAVQYPGSPIESFRTLTAHIGLALSSDVGGTAYYSLFVAGGILLALSAGANLLLRSLRRGGEE